MPNLIPKVKSELEVWLERQPLHIRPIAERIVGHLGAAQIGSRPNLAVKAALIQDIEKLRQACAEAGS